MGSIERSLSLLSKENRSPVPGMLLSGRKAHLNRLSIHFQLMKFVFFRAKFARRVFPSFWSALKLVLGLPCSLPPSWQLSLFPDDGCLPAYAKKNKKNKNNCGLNSVSPRQLVLQWKEISPWPQEMLSTGWAICFSSRPGWRWHSNQAPLTEMEVSQPTRMEMAHPTRMEMVLPGQGVGLGGQGMGILCRHLPA